MRRALRFKVVEWVVQQWDSNPDIAELLGPARRAVQPSVLLQEEMCRSYGDCAVRSKEDYSALMQRDGVYGDQAEAAVAAYLSGVSLDIYVRVPHFFSANHKYALFFSILRRTSCCASNKLVPLMIATSATIST